MTSPYLDRPILSERERALADALKIVRPGDKVKIKGETRVYNVTEVFSATLTDSPYLNAESGSHYCGGPVASFERIEP